MSEKGVAFLPAIGFAALDGALQVSGFTNPYVAGILAALCILSFLVAFYYWVSRPKVENMPMQPEKPSRRRRPSLVGLGEGAKVDGLTISNNVQLGGGDFLSVHKTAEMKNVILNKNLHVPDASDESKK